MKVESIQETMKRMGNKVVLDGADAFPDYKKLYEKMKKEKQGKNNQDKKGKK